MFIKGVILLKFSCNIIANSVAFSYHLVVCITTKYLRVCVTKI